MKRLRAGRSDVVCVCLCVAACSNGDADRQRSPVADAASGRATLLATIPDDPSPPAPPPALVPRLHFSLPTGTHDITFSERGGSVAFVVERGDESLVVHDGRPGKAYAAVRAMVLSPDGRRIAHGARVGGRWHMVVDGKAGAGFSAVKMPAFSPDGAHVAYQAMAGDRWHLVVDSKVNAGTRTRVLRHAFSGDSSRIVFIDDADDRDVGRMVVSDIAFEKPTAIAAGVSRMEVNADRTRVAFVGASGKQRRVSTFGFDEAARVATGAPYDGVDRLVFGPDGVSLAYVAERAGERFMVLNGNEEPLSPGDEPMGAPVIRPDGKALGALVASGGGVALQQFFADGGRRGAAYEEAEGLVYSADGRSHAFAARRGASWFAVVDGKEGPPFDRVVTPSFSPDGKLVAYRARKDGARFVVVAERTGANSRRHPSHEQVFPVQFTADGGAIAYGVKDGQQLRWNVEAP